MRGSREERERRVRSEAFEVAPEDVVAVSGTLVSRPALDDAELPGMVQCDVDRAVAAFGKACDRTRVRARDRAVARIDCPHDVACDEGRPTLVRRDSVGPLLVREDSGRAVGHDENRRLTEGLRVHLVLDDAHPHREQKRERPAGEAVQEVDDRVALLRVLRVSGRQIDVDRLRAVAECGARDVDPLLRPGDRDVARVDGRREAAVEPVVAAVAVDADEADRNERSRQHRRACGDGFRCASPPP